MGFDLQQIKDLMAALEGSGLNRIQLKTGDLEIVLEKGRPEGEKATPPPAVFVLGGEGGGRGVAARPAPPSPAASAESPPPPSAPGTFIKAPMVGTFYAAPSPGEPPFVKVGETVTEDTIVGIVEAMKVMNEVKAGVAGTIREVLVQSGDPVEYGTKLFSVGS